MSCKCGIMGRYESISNEWIICSFERNKPFACCEHNWHLAMSLWVALFVTKQNAACAEQGSLFPLFFLFYCYRLTWIYIKINFKTRLSWSHWIKMEKNKNFIPIAWLNEWRRLTLLVCTAIVIVACDQNEVFCCCCAVNISERLKNIVIHIEQFLFDNKKI